ncbi:MAG: Lrp/AsnC family transcriptional regulator, partial [Acidobacteria bacterium]|nr:Lrp/AsnC family transcriptional regulator [Acidobacteriota bacterium]
EILKILSNDGRAKIIDIAIKTGISAEMVLHKIKKFKKDKVILGFRAVIRMKKLGYNYSMILLNVRNLSYKIKEDIITTLGTKEGQVINFLLEEQKKYVDEGKNAKNFYVSQATIIRGLQMPKTSMTRVLESLKNKNIINIEKIGKLKKISFTEWFDSK